MSNKIKDKFVELLDIIVQPGEKTLGDIADYFIENRAFVLPYKVGSVVHVLASQTSNDKNFYMFTDTITHYNVVDDTVIMCFNGHMGEPDWNWDRVYTDRDEARAKLKELNSRSVEQ